MKAFCELATFKPFGKNYFKLQYISTYSHQTSKRREKDTVAYDPKSEHQRQIRKSQDLNDSRLTTYCKLDAYAKRVRKNVNRCLEEDRNLRKIQEQYTKIAEDYNNISSDNNVSTLRARFEKNNKCFEQSSTRIQKYHQRLNTLSISISEETTPSDVQIRNKNHELQKDINEIILYHKQISTEIDSAIRELNNVAMDGTQDLIAELEDLKTLVESVRTETYDKLQGMIDKMEDIWSSLKEIKPEARLIDNKRNDTHITEIRASVRVVVEQELEVSASRSTLEDKIIEIYTDSEGAKRIDIAVNMLMQIFQEELNMKMRERKERDDERIVKKFVQTFRSWMSNKALDWLWQFFKVLGKLAMEHVIKPTINPLYVVKKYLRGDE